MFEAEPKQPEPELSNREHEICWNYHNALAEWHRSKADKHLGELALRGVIPTPTYERN